MDSGIEELDSRFFASGTWVPHSSRSGFVNCLWIPKPRIGFLMKKQTFPDSGIRINLYKASIRQLQ